MGGRVQRERVATTRFILGSTVTRVLGALLFTVASYGALAQAVGEPAKLNSIRLFDGSQFDAEIVKGKVTLLYFWASWCPICRTEMPTIEQHYLKYKDKGFTVLAVNFRDKEENARKLLLDVAPIDYPVATITDEYQRDYPKLYGTPTWYLIDRKGTIKKIVIGQQTITGGWFDGVKKELEAALAESP